MTCRIENGVVYTHAYNAENRASSIAKRNTGCTGTIIESWLFAYDGNGTRVLTAHFTGTRISLQGASRFTTSLQQRSVENQPQHLRFITFRS
ncbi:MAG: hypothetical protein MHPDNHAH_01916 [Anaerolineales bacterium]|nr:hypothetical protein [Anaerolineales bacterium]